MNRHRTAQDAPESLRGVHTLPTTPDALTRPVRAIAADFLGALIWTALLIGLMAV